MFYKKIFFCLSMLLIVATSLVEAQEDYFLHVLEDDYTELSNPISLNQGQVWDDPNYVIPIGFDFEYKHIVTDTLYFGGLGATLFFNDPIAFDYGLNSDFVLYGLNPTIIDLVDRAGTNDIINPTISLSPISYQVDYSNYGRILKIEWKNVGSYEEIDENEYSNDYINFQVWFYEGTNDIAIHFGNTSVSYPQYTYQELGGEIIFLGSYDWVEDVVDPSALELRFIYGDDSLNPTLSLVNAAEVEDQINMLTLNAPVPEHLVYYLSQDSIPPITEPLATALQETNNQSISLFPNPSEHYIAIKGLDSYHYRFKIYDIFGKLVQENTLNSEFINTSMLISGSYILELVTDNSTIVKKFLKN